jgi:hypothetical protein
MQNIPPAMVLFRFLFYPANNKKIDKHFTASFVTLLSLMYTMIMEIFLPDSLEWEHLGEQSIEHQQLQSSHAQAISGNIS